MRVLVVGFLVTLLPLTAFAQESEMKTVVDFTRPEEARWNIGNDGVMGGSFDGVSYTLTFDTRRGEWMEIVWVRAMEQQS